MQKKIQLDLDHKARKSTQKQAQATSTAAVVSSTRNDRRSDVDDITLEDMYVIDSAGECSASGDEKAKEASDAPDADRDRSTDAGDASTLGRATSDARRRTDFQLFLSYLRSVDCKYQVCTHSGEA